MTIQSIYRYLIFSVLFILIFSGLSRANHITVSGTLANNTTWRVDTVRVQGDIFIPDSVRLTIRSGTLVEFWGVHKFNVRGSVRAVGKSNDSIHFLPISGITHWEGFHMDSTSTDSSLFEFCHFELAGANRTPYGEARGGAFALNEVRHLRISHSRFQACYSGREGGVIWANNSSPEISYNIMNNNRSQGAGGCITIESSNLSKVTGSNPFIHHNNLFNNQSGGGTIYCKDNAIRFFISHNEIINNVSSSRGGGISLLSSDVQVTNNLIRGNESQGYTGGGIFVGDSRARIDSNTIDSNLAYSSQFFSTGGGIAIEFSYGVLIRYNTISDNKTRYGGAVSIKRGSVSLIKNQILRNDAQANGSALYCEAGLGGSVTATVDSNEIRDNARVAFACIYGNSSTTLKVRGNHLENNGGGGMWSQDRRSEFVGNTVISSSAYGIKCINFKVESNTIKNCETYGIIAEEDAEILNNELSGNGWGGIYVDGYSPRIENNHFYFNGDSLQNGGALKLIDCNSLIVNNAFRNNLAEKGGAIYCSKGKPVFSSNLFSNNTAVKEGGAIFLEDDTTKPIFINSTMVNNEAGTKEGAVYSKAQNWVDHHNGVYYGNRAASGGDQYFVFYDNYDPNFYFSDVEGTYRSFDLNFGSFSGQYINNLDTNPKFRLAAASVGYLSDTALMADWRLGLNSPLVNQGDTMVYYLPKLDLAGERRVQGDSIDMGAYELSPPLNGNVFFIGGNKYCEGSNLSILSTVNKTSSSFVWHFKGVPINGASLINYTISSLSALDTGQYYCVFSVGAETDTSNTVRLEMWASPKPGSLGPDTSICRQSPYVLKTSTPYSFYNWNNGLSTADTISVTQAGTYFLEVKDSNFCAGFTDTVEIKIFSAPALNLGSDTNLCLGDSLYLNVAFGFSSYMWSDGFSGMSRWLKSSGIYILTTSDTNNCSYQDSIQADFNLQVVAGVVRDQRMDPLPGSLVELLSFNAADTSLVLEDSTRTDINGFYSMPNIAGPMNLRVSAFNHVPQYAPNVPVVQQSDTIILLACGTSFYDFGLQYDIYSALIGSIGGHISNLNTLLPISPVRETRVLLVRAGIPWRMTKTVNGYFHFQDLNAGTYELWIDRMFIDNNLAPKIVVNSGTHHTDSLALHLRPDRLVLVGNLGFKDDFFEKIEIRLQNRILEINSGDVNLDQLSIYDLQGRQVISEDINLNNSNIKIDLQHLSTGMYMLNIRSGSKSFAKKLILY